VDDAIVPLLIASGLSGRTPARIALEPALENPYPLAVSSRRSIAVVMGSRAGRAMVAAYGLASGRQLWAVPCERAQRPAVAVLHGETCRLDWGDASFFPSSEGPNELPAEVWGLTECGARLTVRGEQLAYHDGSGASIWTDTCWSPGGTPAHNRRGRGRGRCVATGRVHVTQTLRYRLGLELLAR
jgi:hypothetical protein